MGVKKMKKLLLLFIIVTGCVNDYESVRLPGSMAENGQGDDVTVKTGWTGDIVDRSYFTQKKYEKYRQPGNI